MKKIILDKYLCVRCGQCIGACPARLFDRPTLNDYPETIENADEFCISCHHCLAVCPVHALSIDGIDGTMCLDFVRESFPRFEHIATLARMRRSIRRYADKPLEKQVIEQLLDVVRWAPSAKNKLPVKWLVVNNRNKVLELEELVVQWLRSQPQLSNVREVNEPNGIFRGAPCVVVAYTDATALWPAMDTAIAVETLDLCATAMRLGACWAGYFIRASQNDPTINRWLGLSETEIVHGGLMLGYIGDEAYQRVPYRPELELRWI
ncbi:MAG: nitroreductase family protein [Planctomycetaceae bacterium]|jgi:nitroreductase/NAD-dependent dihydropyrimidine dehydrogenase PreA subunit|nr:nitroreductase family protein [Planctomycetaceae bacterium]